MINRVLDPRSPWVGSLHYSLITAVAVSIVAVAVVQVGWLDDLRIRIEDGYFPIERAAENVAVVATDLSAPRSHRLQGRTDALATLTQNTLDAGADLVVIDPTFSGLGTSGMEELVASGRVVIPLSAVRVGRAELDPGAPWAPMPEIEQMEGFEPAAVDGELVAGHVMLSGIAGRPVRCASLVGRLDGEELTPSIDLVAWARSRGLSTNAELNPGEISIGGRSIPTGPEGCLRVGFREDLAPGGAAVIDAMEVIDGRIDREQVEGKVVYLGDTSPDLGGIITYETPMGAIFPAVFVRASVLESLSDGSPSSQSTTELILAVFILTLAVTLITLVSSPLLAVSVALAASLMVQLGGRWRFASSLVMTDTLLLIGAIATGLLAGLVVKGMREMARRRRVSDLFSTYVPEYVARELMDVKHIDDLLEGSRCDVAVLFVDICGFTRLSGSMSAQGVRNLLDGFYSEVVPIVLDHGGTVVNFIGDEVYAVFGAPLPVDGHSSRAIACAREIQLMRESAPSSLPSYDALAIVSYSIGVHAGEAVAAHVGNDFRRQYTIVGDTVNIGSRLCDRAGPGEVVFSEPVLRALADHDDLGAWNDLGAVALRNVAHPIHLYSIRPTNHPLTGSGDVPDAHVSGP